jgi:hypothetical protein
MNAQRLNLILTGLLLIGGFSSYQFGNFDGVTYEELTQSYIAKNDLKFSDLPLKMQARYIDKELTVEQSKEGSLFEDELLDENGKPVLEEQATPRDFKRSIQKLQKMVLFLQHDNLVTMNEKNELARKLEEQTTDIDEEKEKFQRKNLEKLNEVEQQHYKNISDLTTKLNELQKENVLIAQQGNVEIITLKQHIEDLKIQALEEAKKKEHDIKVARAEEQDKLVDYKEKIRLLNDQLSLVNQQLTTQTENIKTTLNRKNDEVSSLKTEISKLDQEKHVLIKNHNAAMEAFKNETEKLLVQSKQEFKLKEEALNQTLAQSDDKLKLLNTDLLNAKKQIDTLHLENEKDFTKFRTYLEDEKKLNQDLHVTIKKIEEENKLSQKSLQENITKEQESLKQKEKKIQELEATISTLQNHKIDIEAEIKRKIDENDKVHNKNYKIFNEKIATFEKSKQELLQAIDKQLSDYKLASEENRKNADTRVEELNRTNHDLVLKNEASAKEVVGLKTSLEKLSLDHQKTLESEREKIKIAQDASESLRKSIAQKEADALAKINALESQLRTKEIAQAGSKREDALKITALEKEVKSKEMDLLALKDTSTRKDETIASLHVKLKQKDENTTITGNKQIDSLKEKLAILEKARLEEEKKQRSVNDEFKRKELNYLDQIKELGSNAKQNEKNLLLAKEGIEKKLFASEEAIKALQAKVKSGESQPTKAIPLISDKPNKPSSKKLQVLESVSCADMGTGVNALSSRCKNEIETMLKKYDDSYFFEVTPIIDTGGFASLKLIKSKKVGIEDGEIDRISGLANIGLGKARAQTGGELILQHIGANAKISYALSPLEQDKSRGFLIKVYQ